MRSDFKEVNLRAQWKWNFRKSQSLIFSAEAFNVFNWDNIELAGATVQNYCAAPVPADCGFGAPTNPNFLQLVDQNPASVARKQDQHFPLDLAHLDKIIKATRKVKGITDVARRERITTGE